MLEISECIDGINCINVYSKGYTEIGRFYSNFSHTEINCVDGIFSSIEAYWYWLLSGGKSPKDTYGNNAKKIGKTYEAVDTINQEKIKEAIDIKLRNNLKFIIDNDNFSLPLMHYYDYGNKKVDGGYRWIIEHIESRREILKNYKIKK